MFQLPSARTAAADAKGAFMEEKKRKLSRRRWLEIGIGALLVLLLISWAAVLCATETDREASAARKRKFAVARVGRAGG